MSDERDDHLRELVAEVSAAYFANAHVVASDIPNVVRQIAQSLSEVRHTDSAPEKVEEPAAEVASTKVTSAQVRRSITDDALISFEDGKSYKTLKRHLSTRGLTPADYRAKWGLPSDYPMVAPSYSASRSQMAKSIGLGRKPATPAKARRGKSTTK